MQITIKTFIHTDHPEHPEAWTLADVTVSAEVQNNPDYHSEPGEPAHWVRALIITDAEGADITGEVEDWETERLGDELIAAFRSKRQAAWEDRAEAQVEFYRQHQHAAYA